MSDLYAADDALSGHNLYKSVGRHTASHQRCCSEDRGDEIPLSFFVLLHCPSEPVSLSSWSLFTSHSRRPSFLFGSFLPVPLGHRKKQTAKEAARDEPGRCLARSDLVNGGYVVRIRLSLGTHTLRVHGSVCLNTLRSPPLLPH